MTEERNKDPRVAVVMGGQSSEHEISLKSGAQVLAALPAATGLKVVIDLDGRWTIEGEPEKSPGAALEELKQRADVVFLALHGENGEDGTIQGFLESASIPYTGSGVLGSALAMDKVRTKLVYRAVGLPTPEFEAVDRARLAEPGVVASIADKLGFPCVLKPSRAGSSVGIQFPKDAAELARDLEEAVEKTGACLIERCLSGREFTCGVLAHEGDLRLQALPITEIIPDPNKYEYFDYEAKYTPGATDEVTPADIPEALATEMQALARSAHRWLDCRDMSRTDFMLDEDGRPSVLETNTIPGFTAQSLLPQAAKVAGYDFPALVRHLISNAAARSGL